MYTFVTEWQAEVMHQLMATAAMYCVAYGKQTIFKCNMKASVFQLDNEKFNDISFGL